MKPTQEQILRLIQENKPKKELLSVQKVELGMIDDFDKLFEKSLDASIKIQSTFIDAVSKAQSQLKSNSGIMEKALKIGDELKKAAKDLGIDLPKSVLNKIDSAGSEIKEAKMLTSKLQQLYKLF